METQTTQTTAANTALTAGAGTETSQQPAPIAPSTNTRPEYIPEKFWNKETGAPEVDKLGASYLSLEQAFNRKHEVKKPGTEAKPEEVEKYYADVRKITGAPETPEGYGLKAPDNLPAGVEWNGELAGKAAAIAHKHGIAPEALHELIALNNETMGGIVAKSAEAEKARVDEVVSTLDAEWGTNAKDNWQRARRGAIAMGVDVEKSDLATHPEFIRIALNHDKDISDDKGLVHGDNTQATYEEQMTKIQKGDDYQGINGVPAQQAALARLKAVFDASKAK